MAIEIIVDIVTPLSLVALVYQLWQRKKQFTTEFEDNFTDQYRDVAIEIPVDALLDDSDGDGYRGDLKQYYRYVDLTNEQIFLRKEGRISKSTWENWRKGIESHLDRDDFRRAWQEIRSRDPDSFKELQKFENKEFPDDPRRWDHSYRAFLEAWWYSIWNRGG
ncbi:hypothetical protein [Haloplanus pelagicus]|uniref:hypothetical protein n=1 Tax=Haloplanus pelagicus TaxID=2949995 RepID=UPI00203C6B18|nr:hypothetical protein [Haloplanus sp. HW8-1]